MDENGSVRIIAFVPNPLLTLGGQLVPVSDSVPTCVAQGPDGFLYIGTLAFGAYFASGDSAQSKVYRISPTLSNAILTDSDVWASGFYPITGCGFGHGAFYVTEYFTTSPAAPGDLIKVALNADGSAGTRTIMGGGLLKFPNGFAAGPRWIRLRVQSQHVSWRGTVSRVSGWTGCPGELLRLGLRLRGEDARWSFQHRLWRGSQHPLGVNSLARCYDSDPSVLRGADSYPDEPLTAAGFSICHSSDRRNRRRHPLASIQARLEEPIGRTRLSRLHPWDAAP